MDFTKNNQAAGPSEELGNLLAKPVGSKPNYTVPIIIIGVLFFLFGFVTWANSTLIQYLKIACQLTSSEAIFVTFAFYISYAVMAFPCSWVLRKTGFKNGMMVGLLIMAAGALIFIPAADARAYTLFLVGLFVIGTGLTLLQTASNPYITILGPIESAAKRISIMGICNKTAGTLAPLILGAIMLKDADTFQVKLATMNAAAQEIQLNALASKVVLPYVIIAVVLVLLGIGLYFSSLPEIKAEGEDETIVGTSVTNRSSATKYPYLWLGFIALFLYVGVEVICGDLLPTYGVSMGYSLDQAKNFTSYTLIGMLVGYVIGIVTIPKLISQTTALKASAILGIILTLVAIYSGRSVSVPCIAILGLANALMWPGIWPLTLEGLGKYTKFGAALLIIGIAGGAIMPQVWVFVGKHIGNQNAFWIMIPCYLFILYFAISGNKVGKTVAIKEV